jgi:uncharacterized protein (TIGR00369 family)
MTGPTGSHPTPPALAERIAADPYGRWLGIELLELRPGYCRAGLTLAPHMTNFHGSPHGGAIFSLADFVFGGACNGHGEPAVALTVTIQFHAAARVGRLRGGGPRHARQARWLLRDGDRRGGRHVVATPGRVTDGRPSATVIAREPSGA